MDHNWLGSVSEAAILDTLPPAEAANIRYLEASGMEPLEIGSYLVAQGEGAYSTRSLGRDAAEYWQRLKHEMHLLICTDDPKYASMRQGFGKESNVTSAVALSMLSSAVSAHLGIEAGLATPLVALTLLALLRTNKEAWCAQVGGPPASPPVI